MSATFQAFQNITAKTKEFCSFEIQEKGLAFAQVSFENPKLPVLKACGFRNLDNINQLESALANIILEYELKNINCNIVLSPNFYRILLVNTPSVSPEEYRSAVRWQIKEMIDYPVEDIVVDIFAPTGLVESESKKLYVIVAQSSFLQNLVDILSRNQVPTAAIDIHEFAIRNLIAKTPYANEAVIFLQFESDECLLLVFENQKVNFVRRIPIGFNRLQTSTDTADITAEIQRSLNYYNSELKQAVPNKIILGPVATEKIPLMNAAVTSLAEEINILDINKIISYFEPLTPEIQERCYVALGGALRSTERK